jgi:hypothetical protein
LQQAQQDGILPTHYKAAELLALVRSTSTTWSSMNPEYGVGAPADRAQRRRTVTERGPEAACELNRESVASFLQAQGILS